MSSLAYTEYMKLADNLFIHLKNGTQETDEESKNIDQRQSELLELMSPEEIEYADEQVLRTVLWIKGA